MARRRRGTCVVHILRQQISAFCIYPTSDDYDFYRPRTAELLPISSALATSAFEDILPTIYQEVELDIRCRAYRDGGRTHSNASSDSISLDLAGPPSSTGTDDPASAALEATDGILDAQEVISLAVSILATVQVSQKDHRTSTVLTETYRVRSNQVGFQQLGKDIGDVRAIVESRGVQSFDMKKSLRELVSLPTEIKAFALEHTSHSILHRVVTGGMDSSKIQLEDYRVQIGQALLCLGMHEDTVQKLKELRERGPNVGPQSSNPVPSDSLRDHTRAFQRLLSLTLQR
ncbi:hypothetical protein B0H13DRAFT_2334513 [Mycena leptocephala]|nr:hypothetical protein B0H13DRAFT_2334513 [Mycena leptocephala]